ncbi:MAG: ferrochelatase, partial [Gammaproteobacteria bacterium]|nr:ferrochelatase [Gammaproteobacteria bacterium]
MNKPALLLVNLGTPDSPSYFHVFKYLREFLMDGRVIDVPAFFRFILVTLIICPFRSFSSSKVYKELWELSGGVSPLLKNTDELTKKLNLSQDNFNVHFAMRYQSPSIK